jgi:rare lipoprotein A
MTLVLPKARTLFLAGLLAGSLVLAVSLTARAEPVVATYYGDGYVGAPTASGEPYDPNDYTAAHPYLPFGTQLLVSHNGLSTIVRVNDSCSCGLDLSLAAAQEIGLIEAGVAVVDAEVLGTEAVPMLPADTAVLDSEAVPMPPLPADPAPEVEPFQAPDGLPVVEDQPVFPVTLEDEASPPPPADLAEWPILGLVVPP